MLFQSFRTLRSCLLAAAMAAGLSCPAARSEGGACEKAEAPLPEYVGECWMEADGTISMHLHSWSKIGGSTISGTAFLSYKPGDRDYADILKHVGPIKPGEHK